MDMQHLHPAFQCQPPILLGINRNTVYPLQSQLSQNQRVLHTQLFKEVITGHGANQVRRLMVTEIDSTGQERNRRPEFFFNGILGHVK